MVIALSERVSYDVFTLTDPDRVVVDLPAVRWQVAPDAEPRPSGLIDGLRHGSYKTDVSRLVIDCREPVIVRETGLIVDQKSQYRLFIDLATATQPPPPRTDPAVTAPVISDSALGQVIGRTELLGGDGPSSRRRRTAGAQ
ncbi:MAG: AMIN domain-containing protein [Defluviicoccus sp.]|nr:MAG: AMIN domain-containing protein [Defluviicoccus sp.]